MKRAGPTALQLGVAWCCLAIVCASLTRAAESTGNATARPCVFCEIAAGRLDAARVIYRDASVIAFLDHAPRNPGHVLIAPLTHARDLLDVPSPIAGHMMRVAQTIAQAIATTDLQAEGFNVIANSGAAAGQSVFHLHLHVIPRFATEPPVATGPKTRAAPGELEAVAAKLRAALARQPKVLPLEAR